jgi:hypothetical protein
MEYEQASIIGKRRRADAALALSNYVRERVAEVCAVKPSKDSGLDARDWRPVDEVNFKEICIRAGPTGDRDAYLLVVDGDGTAKACTQRTYPLPIAMQMAWAIPLPVYAGRSGELIAEIQDAAMRRAQQVPQMPEL